VTVSAYGMAPDVMGEYDIIGHSIIPATGWTMAVTIAATHPSGVSVTAAWSRSSGSDTASYGFAERTIIATL
jgi:hypothetical protein